MSVKISLQAGTDSGWTKQTTTREFTHALEHSVFWSRYKKIYPHYYIYLIRISFSRIHPNLRSTVYCSAIASGGADEWDFGWLMFKNAIGIEADKLMSALACAKDTKLLERFEIYCSLGIYSIFSKE